MATEVELKNVQHAMNRLLEAVPSSDELNSYIAYYTQMANDYGLRDHPCVEPLLIKLQEIAVQIESMKDRRATVDLAINQILKNV